MKSVVSEKGQVTIPKPLRERLGLKKGQVLEMEAEGGRLIARKATQGSPFDGVYGILRPSRTTREWLTELRGAAERRRR